MIDTIQVNWNGRDIQVKRGVTLQELAEKHSDSSSPLIVAAKVDNRIRELTYKVEQDCRIEPIDLSMKDGERIYTRSLVFLFLRACRELYRDCSVTVEHSFGGGLYCEIHDCITLSPREVERIEKRMRRIVEQMNPLKRRVSMEKPTASFCRWVLSTGLRLCNTALMIPSAYTNARHAGLSVRTPGTLHRL